MNKLTLVRYRDTNNMIIKKLLTNTYEFHKLDDNNQIIDYLFIESLGRNYQQKKQLTLNMINLCGEFLLFDSDIELSQDELKILLTEIKKISTRLGLLKEVKNLGLI